MNDTNRHCNYYRYYLLFRSPHNRQCLFSPYSSKHSKKLCCVYHHLHESNRLEIKGRSICIWLWGINFFSTFFRSMLLLSFDLFMFMFVCFFSSSSKINLSQPKRRLKYEINYLCVHQNVFLSHFHWKCAREVWDRFYFRGWRLKFLYTASFHE